MSRKELLERLSAASFAAVDLQLYMDTHPEDKAALAKLNKYLDQTAALVAEYTRQFGPLSPQDIYGDTSFDWVNSPWPWSRDFVEGDK